MAKTISELRNQSIQVRDASAAGENTATRVGTVLNDIVGHIEDYENTQSSNNSSQDAKIEGVKSSLNAEIARAKTEESNLSTQIGTERTERQAAVSREETARIQADNDEKTARQQADNAEQDARIKADNDEKTARENADITLRTMIQTEVSNRQIAVKQEEIRAKAAEQANTQAIEDENTRATAEEERLQGEIGNTIDNLNSLEDKVNSNHDHFSDEVARLDTTDIEIKAGLEAETARAAAAEEANAQAITDEVARAQAAEQAIIFDVSAHNNGAVFESIFALLSDSNLDTLIPVSFRHGGMTIRFIQGSEQSSDNKYVQYLLTNNEWSVSVADWQKMNLEEEVSQLDKKVNGVVLSGVATNYKVIFKDGVIPAGTIFKNTGDVQIQLADGDIAEGTYTNKYVFNSGNTWLSTFDVIYIRLGSVSGNYGLNVCQDFISYSKNQSMPETYKAIARENIDAPKISDLNVFIKKTAQTLSLSESEQVAANLNMTDTWDGSGARVFVSQKGVRNGVYKAQQEKGYRICSSGRAATQKVVAEDGISVNSATKNMVYLVKFKWPNTANEPTLKFEHSEEHPFYYYGSPVTSTNCWKAGDVLLIWYDGTNYQSVCVSDEKERLDFLENNRTQIFNPISYAMRCFHHDNFARTETGYAIGKNAPAAYNVNDYEFVSSDSYDDGLIVNNGATWSANNARTETYSLRRIAKTHEPYACVETNAPTNKMVGIAWNVIDVNNFKAIRASTYITTSDDTVYTRFTFDFLSVVDGGETIIETKYFRIKSMDFSDPSEIYMPQVMQLYFLNGDLHIFIDGEFATSIYVGEVNNSFCLFARKNATYHYDFINCFNLQDPKKLDFFRPIDNNNKCVPNTNLDFVAENYEMTNEVARWSQRSEHFIIHSNDTPIANGIRCERGLIINPSDANSYSYPFCKQLRDLVFSFDVMFPSTAEFDEAAASYHDTFFQIHDSISIPSRGDVPITIALIGSEARIRQTGTHSVSQGTVDVYAAWEKLFDVIHDRWYHIELKLHERYDTNQHPYTEIFVDGQTVFKSYYPNCYNDPVAGFPKYGEYKNGWKNVTISDRYFDNVSMKY